MFGYCIWYTLIGESRLCKLILNLSNKFKTDLFKGHITVHSKLNEQTANNLYRIQCCITKPWFSIDGNVYQTESVSENNTRFYALQQDYLMYNIERLGRHHVSLAYRINRPFTEEEIEYANSMVPIDTICENEMFVSLNDCKSCLPKHWNQLKRHVF